MRPILRRLGAALGSALVSCGAALVTSVPVAFTLAITTAPAAAQCLGTERTIRLDPSRGHFYNGLERSLGLRDGEVILTFDDGPVPGKTTRILDALAAECVRATFFMAGRMAAAYPQIAQRVRREGHTIAGHTYGHENLANLNTEAGRATVRRGMRAVRNATGLRDVPFFRYPYLAKSARTDAMIRSEGLIAFGTNIDSKDYKKVSSATVVEKLMRTLRKQRKGIVLMHDIHARTAAALPVLLDRLKAEGFRVVHMVPGRGVAPVAETVVARAAPDARRKPDEREVALALPEPRAEGRSLAGRRSRSEDARDWKRRPTLARAYANGQSRTSRERERLARIDLTRRGSLRGGKAPMNAAEIARARQMVRKNFRARPSLPLHGNGRVVTMLKRR